VAIAAGIQRSDALKPLRILSLPKYDRLGASSRLRSLQYSPWLESAGLQVQVQPLLADALLQSRYQHGDYRAADLLAPYWNRYNALLSRSSFDLLWIEKEALPWWPLWLELALLRGVPYVLDYDDAIFHNYDRHSSAFIRHVYGKRVDGLMSRATLVLCGNEYLAQRAREAGAPWVEVLPTVIDLGRYNGEHNKKASQADGLPRVVWIGSPATVHYLQVAHHPLQILASKVPFVLRVIGGGVVQLPGIQVETVPWSEKTEEISVAAGDVGIMPLYDSPWERGKCGYKLIQYMACGLPVVASPIGMNSEIVRDGITGLLADTPDQWVQALERLLTHDEERAKMGREGRTRVEAVYCIQQTGPRVAQLLQRAARGK